MAREEIKKKRKKWVSIVSREFNNMTIGESLVTEPGELIGKKIRVNLMSITNDPKKQSVNVVFKIKEIKGEQVVAELIGYETNQAHVKRLVRKACTKIDDSFVLDGKDGKYRIKPIIITRHKIQKRMITEMRKIMREVIGASIKDSEKWQIFLAAISNKMQMEIKNSLKRISPIGISEIRVLERV